MVWKIDRWGGSLTHLVTSLAELDAYGVAFVSLRDNLDLSTPSGRLMMLPFLCLSALRGYRRSSLRRSTGWRPAMQTY